MAMLRANNLFVFSLLILFLSSSLGYEREDPRQDTELLQCKDQCRAQQQYDVSQIQQCENLCEDYVKQKHESEAGAGTVGGGDDRWSIVEKELQQCQTRCHSHRQPVAQREICERRCLKKSEEHQKEQGGDENPYVFRKERMSTKMASEEGKLAVLERFNRRSELLDGIENYRVAFVEISPNAFMLPDHWDADSIIMVVNGKGSVTLIEQENKKETHQLKRGDIMRLPSGSIVHTINTDNKEKFIVAELIIPVSTPGRFEAFSAPGHKGQESFFNAFSDEILEAAFDTGKDEVKKLFKGENEGPFVKASEKQIKALSKSSSKSGKQSYNLLNQRPSESNKYGQLYEINTKEYKQLQDLDVQVSYANITRGGMIAPYYNSRATKIAVVVDGGGYIEMACPHLSKQKGSHYQRASAQVKRGDVYVVPAGHPIVTVASEDQNLEVLCFEINAADNQRIPLAGKNNILMQLQDEAKELSFNIEAKQVDDILSKQKESWFFPGPQQHGGGGGGGGSK